MRKSHELVIRHFVVNRTAKHDGNLSTDGRCLYLFNNIIARWDDNNDLQINPIHPHIDRRGRSQPPSLTKTTTSAISALCFMAGVSYNVGNEKYIPVLSSNLRGTRLVMEVDQWYYISGPDHGKPVN